jgi:hypothetical protein
MVDQARWAQGHGDGDLERDPAEREPSLGAPETIVDSVDADRGDQERWAKGGTRDLEGGGEDDEPEAGR